MWLDAPYPRVRYPDRGNALGDASETCWTGISVGVEPTSLFILMLTAMVVWGILLPFQLAAALG